MDAIFNIFGGGKAKGGPAVDGAEDPVDRLPESDEFFKKWSGPLILGAFVPALFALITVVGGTMTLGSWKGSCGFPLDGKFIVMQSY